MGDTSGRDYSGRAARAAANRIDDAGYCTAGGHGNWSSRCYDCSGAISYVLGPKSANILKAPLDSGSRLVREVGRARARRLDHVKAGMVNGPYVKRHYAGL